MNLPNKLTVARLFMVPVFVVALLFDSVWGYAVAWFVFTTASFTDYLDGRIARARNLITRFGKLMDPLADKVLVTSAFVMMLQVPLLDVPAWTVVAILAREFLVTGARSMAATDGSTIAANMWGKAKAMVQMIYIGAFLFLCAVCKAVEVYRPDDFDQAAHWLALSSYWIAVGVALLTVYSGIQFAQTNWANLDLGSDT